jgi:hypothetical protein
MSLALAEEGDRRQLGDGAILLGLARAGGMGAQGVLLTRPVVDQSRVADDFLNQHSVRIGDGPSDEVQRNTIAEQVRDYLENLEDRDGLRSERPNW